MKYGRGINQFLKILIFPLVLNFTRHNIQQQQKTALMEALYNQHRKSTKLNNNGIPVVYNIKAINQQNNV